ncbi:MAG TPA: sugar transferase [Herpetosiphonaceae bacterium]|nr:sugar transferase [Herpetosiphonaceae bacterium]
MTIVTFWIVFVANPPSPAPSRNLANLPLLALILAIWWIVFLIIAPQRILFTGRLVEAVARLIRTLLITALTFAGTLYLFRIAVERQEFLRFTALNFVVLFIFHLLVRTYIRLRRPDQQRRVLLVGSDSPARAIVQALASQPWTGIRIVGYLGDERADISAERLPWLGPADKTVQVCGEHNIDEIIFAMQDQAFISQVALELQPYSVMIHMVPGPFNLFFSRTTLTEVAGIPLISLHESVLTEPQRLLKWFFDMVISAILLILCAPLMALIALAIKLDSPGPIFFIQERIGEHGRRFKMLKFRTMHQDAAARWQQVASRTEDGLLIHKVSNDPRVTTIGQRLRRTSLDELPQLINVLRGEMSLVGPRPEVPYIVEEYQAWQWERFRVPPGITGWWQVNGRSSRPMHHNTEDDLYYVRNYSFWLDLKILCKTVTAVVSKQGAF